MEYQDSWCDSLNQWMDDGSIRSKKIGVSDTEGAQFLVSGGETSCEAIITSYSQEL